MSAAHPAGGEPARVTEAVALAMSKLPKVSGDAQPFMDSALVKVLDEAEKLAKKAGDSFVPVERLLMALALVPGAAKQALDAGAVTAQKLNAAINDIRKGRTADTASAEEGYDALKKYARDLTEAAREGKLDPVIGRDTEIRQAIDILMRRRQNNPILTGEAGVGKTSVVEGFALRIVAGILLIAILCASSACAETARITFILVNDIYLMADELMLDGQRRGITRQHGGRLQHCVHERAERHEGHRCQKEHAEDGEEDAQHNGAMA